MLRRILVGLQLAGFFLSFLPTYANTDTLHLSVNEAEQRLLDQNLQVLAAHYEVDIAKAQIIQARLFPNLHFSWEQNIYNTVTKRFFPMGSGGQNIFSLSQMFEIAGQRNKRIQMEKTKTAMSLCAFYDLLRTLSYTLRSLSIQSHYTANSLVLLQEEINSLQKLVDAFDEQQRKGNVTLKEVVRLKTLLFYLHTRQDELQAQQNEQQRQLKILLRDSTADFMVIDLRSSSTLPAVFSAFTYDALRDTALANRQDLQGQAYDIRLAQQNFTYQKLQAVPALQVGVLYDRAGSYVNNYTAFTLSLDLPVWNHNEGNIRSSRLLVKEKEALYEYQRTTVEQETLEAYRNVNNRIQLISSVDARYINDLRTLMEGMRLNFEKGNISMLEFVDFFESYSNTLLDYNELNIRLYDAVEQLNFSVGKIVIDLL